MNPNVLIAVNPGEGQRDESPSKSVSVSAQGSCASFWVKTVQGLCFVLRLTETKCFWNRIKISSWKIHQSKNITLKTVLNLERKAIPQEYAILSHRHSNKVNEFHLLVCISSRIISIPSSGFSMSQGHTFVYRFRKTLLQTGAHYLVGSLDFYLS